MNDLSYAAPTTPNSVSPHLEADSVRFFKAWILFFLLSAVCSAGAGFLVGALAGAFMGAAGIDLAIIIRVCQLLGVLVGLPISFICFRWAISRFIVPQVVSLVAPAHVNH